MAAYDSTLIYGLAPAAISTLGALFSYFAFLLVAEPLVYVKPTGVQYYEIAVAIELFVMTILSTFYANIKCLELLQQ